MLDAKTVFQDVVRAIDKKTRYELESISIRKD